MTSNPLLKSTIVVFFTWWIVFAVITPSPWDALKSVGDLLVILFGGVVGLGGVYVLMLAGRHASKTNLAGSSSRGISISLGSIPIGLGEPARRKGAVLVTGDSRLNRWLEHAKEVHPAHAALLEACLEVYANHPELPASPVPGGHGGLSLLDHSLHVAEVTMEMAETWVYQGGHDKSGRLRVPLIDPDYEFNRNDPLIPVLAFAHDIGKIECYTRDPDGGLVEFRYDHDLVSGLVLSRMKETWALPMKDRVALTYAVSHYHHPVDLPLHADDRTRAIMELLIAADVEASTREGDPDRAKAWKSLADEPDENDVLWDAFTDILATPSTINGSDKENRVGYKFGNFVYLSEERIRFALADALNTPGAADQRSRMGDGRYKISERLMKIMKDKGILYHLHDGKEYSVARALFRVVFMDPRNPDFTIEMPAVIIMQPGGVFPHLLSRTDSRLVPTTVTPLYTEASARNKGLRGKPENDPAPSDGHSAKQPDSEDDARDAQPATPDTSHATDPLSMLNRLKEERVKANRKRRAPQPEKGADITRDRILMTIRRIYSSASGGGLKYHEDEKKGVIFIMLTDELAGSLGEVGVAWLRGSEEKGLMIRSGNNADYLVVRTQYLRMEAES